MQVVGLLTIFREMDADSNGVLTLSELCAALRSKGIDMSTQQTQTLLNTTDMNGDGEACALAPDAQLQHRTSSVLIARP